MDRIVNFASLGRAIVPTDMERVVMGIGAAAGALIGQAVGGIDDAILWLGAFVMVDYVTGIAAGIKTGQLGSKRGFEGIFKKAFIFGVIALCQGMDVILHTDMLRDAAVVAYAANEALSITENIDRMGFGSAIPAPIRRAFKEINEKKGNMTK